MRIKLINQAVTKGLDLNLEVMWLDFTKNSGLQQGVLICLELKHKEYIWGNQ